jgi:hypothetical protein
MYPARHGEDEEAGERGRPAASGVKGHEPVLVQLEPSQRSALRREALKRAAAAGTARPDVSELVREAIDDWLRKRTK